ncbi:4-carboxy-4-hydroxy-2-oxoadipate aldolase/oxaloacetate decarboxylase [Acerihabitans arboris]|uniref:4-hydroxy-4-methyl-2-oxoglutarate aldolase n=1 Tax=Acerihabitans arboris TaxID=2691583 RepID=A0A845SHI8_9GAMM|nr:4-carboxy-4-hydroxy-2-oxoadipate aldolase/oxaloacetate decarboxylase [Acerihabitans arboris]NDL63329.1 4-carboxy-4-hydroxy-2-oxoadipate aldolase/oxaloacetate decarboxylase [Acerihabitans arboris]
MHTRVNALGIVKRNIERTDLALVKRLGDYGVATVHEAMGRTGLMRPNIRPAFAGARLCGNAVTVLAQPGDNLMLHVAAEQIRQGDIVVVACTVENGDGMFGELLATSYRARGGAGLVSEAGVRDVGALRKMGFPVFSRVISAKGAARATPGSVNVPVICAGALVNPGDVIVADDDGVVVVPRELARQTADAAQRREDNEQAKRERFANGELGLDMYQMREMLARAGLKYID